MVAALSPPSKYFQKEVARVKAPGYMMGVRRIHRQQGVYMLTIAFIVSFGSFFSFGAIATW
jgi:hypothetical protein